MTLQAGRQKSSGQGQLKPDQHYCRALYYILFDVADIDIILIDNLMII
jgi:hypothetical protein